MPPLDLEHPYRDLRLELPWRRTRALGGEPPRETCYAVSAIDGAIATSVADGARATWPCSHGVT